MKRTLLIAWVLLLAGGCGVAMRERVRGCGDSDPRACLSATLVFHNSYRWHTPSGTDFYERHQERMAQVWARTCAITEAELEQFHEEDGAEEAEWMRDARDIACYELTSSGQREREAHYALGQLERARFEAHQAAERRASRRSLQNFVRLSTAATRAATDATTAYDAQMAQEQAQIEAQLRQAQEPPSEGESHTPTMPDVQTGSASAPSSLRLRREQVERSPSPTPAAPDEPQPLDHSEPAPAVAVVCGELPSAWARERRRLLEHVCPASAIRAVGTEECPAQSACHMRRIRERRDCIDRAAEPICRDLGGRFAGTGLSVRCECDVPRQPPQPGSVE